MTKDGKQIRVGADIGGTFTDVAMEVGDAMHSAKVLTNYTAPEQGIVDGVRLVAERAGIALDQIDTLSR